MNQSSRWQNIWTFVSSPRWRCCCNFCSSLEISSKLRAGFFVSDCARHISIVLIDALYTLYDYSTQSLIIITTRKILTFLWLMWVISALLFAAQAAASSAWLLTFPATSSHPVPRRGDTEFLCPAELSGSATKSSFTTKTRRHSLPAKNERRGSKCWAEHTRGGTTHRTTIKQQPLHIGTWISVFWRWLTFRSPKLCWCRASENQYCDGTGQKTVDKWNNQDWIWWN